jgi:hypothetical protein
MKKLLTTIFMALGTATTVIAQPAIPNLAKWEAQMLSYGAAHCDESQINQDGIRDESGVWYYDGTRVFYQIGDYTGDPAWSVCARYVQNVYAPYPVTSNALGWRVFPHGLYTDYVRTGDVASKDGIAALATTSAFAWSGGGPSWDLSRETAYLLETYAFYEKLGNTAANLPVSYTFALGHMDQWFGTKSAPIVKPFMVGLTAEALIFYYEEVSEDPAVIAAVRQAADWLWLNAWSPSARAFQYGVCRKGGKYNAECKKGPAPDLNLLIAPMYAWLYHVTGEAKYQEQGDAIFSAGVDLAWLGTGKHFSQNYRWSFDYVRWRS